MRLVDLTVDIPASSRPQRTLQDSEEHPSRWKTTEFRIYIVSVLIVVLVMAWIPISLSSRALPLETLFTD
jgi:hypothetical protein